MRDPEVALSPRTLRHVRGRRCWIYSFGVTFVLLYLATLALTSLHWSSEGLCCSSWWCVTKMYSCTFVAALGWVWYLWRSTTLEDEVSLSLLAAIWASAGTVSVGCCCLLNWAMVQLWARMNPYCYITYPADNWPWAYTSVKCVLINAVQWILTAGVIEESLKFAALLRLCPTMAEVKRSVERGRCSYLGSAPARCLKLADTPIAVALCGVAAGGGLATTENFMYIFANDSIQKAFDENDLEPAYGRIPASFAHMVWTGYAACGLAKWLFLPVGDPGRPRRRTSYLLTPIVLHGLYNWCSTLQRCEPHEEMYKGTLYKSDGCYLSPAWRMVFKGCHTVVMLLSFYWWHREFSDIAGESEDDEPHMAQLPRSDLTETSLISAPSADLPRFL